MKKNMKKVYYKVITDKRSSIVANPSFAVKYPLKKWAKPKIEGSKLMVFSSKKRAKCFIYSKLLEKVVPCYVKNPVRNYTNSVLDVISVKDFNNGGVLRFWKRLREKGTLELCKYFMIGPIPEGTVLCDEVYCLE